MFLLIYVTVNVKTVLL